ncbi:protein phosphatase regulatory subunit Sds22 [Ophidiomyces ophidiicola]|uniref:Protein phosphatase regulatory subunit Sds22 n=1 Tax=Ophidiomyces ophidiicola TaxID=1387563 RepID=A0ACB8V3V9_9EURO|nr:protein phosphatase regulatory subunit Sds22 [Ophidiomyces ophidiicola]KAI1912882.1 protein phosphatase regulatory subunit Sds22 [Ophidiomyces ophidiicola]KAI1930753.1 protein phosphatase regulatory subunit Sds22 [Ophidiomyces ophidiicola]KAI1942936.1 protein phosphatase regulatory subunit Sds22 [Ophidiomyces ophidiicola]KAI1952038.1 protein phosphatase regulatory subunit Sds22 [Ophidiomyces ophidiicola]KAI1962236.1 protein phosphatase regulatory subunit Sds22 [Ophidiomyces ophidiicola]
MKDSKGWDGKLRLERQATLANPEAIEDPEYSDQDAPPVEEIEADEDLLEGVEDTADDIDLVHSRITSIPALKLERFTHLERLCLRQNQISQISFPASLGPTLKDLDLYDNLISHIKGLDHLTNLTSLDLSFNNIKHIRNISNLVQLTDLYFVQDRIQRIENLGGLTKLRNLELGANRIREIENLDDLAALEELWLGKNKITEIKNISHLSNLKILSLPSNRLTSFSGLSGLLNLEELYVSHNAITQISGLESLENLHVLDISNNQISTLENISPLSHLEEFWASNNKLGSFEDVERELRDKKELKTVYFEGNPLQLKAPALYRNKVRLALPQIEQIDAITELGARRVACHGVCPPFDLESAPDLRNDGASSAKSKTEPYSAQKSAEIWGGCDLFEFKGTCNHLVLYPTVLFQLLGRLLTRSKYDYRPKAQNTGCSAFAIFKTAQAATDAVNASPIYVDIPESPISPDKSPPTPSFPEFQHVETTDRKIQCTINFSEHDHNAIIRQNPYHQQFHLSKTWFEFKDLIRPDDTCSVPLIEYADCITRRKRHIAARVKNIWNRYSKENGSMSLEMLWKRGSEKREQKRSEKLRKMNADHTEQPAVENMSQDAATIRMSAVGKNQENNKMKTDQSRLDGQQEVD